VRHAQTLRFNNEHHGARSAASEQELAQRAAVKNHLLKLAVWGFGFAFSGRAWFEFGKAVVNAV
jgi:hypothetical protein